jgi:hypothetical protein
MPNSIVDGEFPDDEITDITYMLQANKDDYEEMLADLRKEDAGEGTKVRVGDSVFLLSDVIKAVIEDHEAENGF